jgi:TetR/AcrR family transcriptional repressor of nem operon
MDRTITRWADLIKGVPAEERLDVIIANYLTSRHRDDPERGCALPALGADVGRSSSKTRRAFAQNLERMIDLVARQLPGDTPQGAREVATGAIATMVGSIVLSRAVGNGGLSDSILAAGRGAAAKQATVRRARRKTGNAAS